MQLVMQDVLCVMEVPLLLLFHLCVLHAKTMEQTITSRLSMLMRVLRRVLTDNIKVQLHLRVAFAISHVPHAILVRQIA